MGSHLGTLVFVIGLIWSFSNSVNNCVQGNCLDDQKALLLQFKQGLTSVYPDYLENSSKRSSWRLNTDCCSSWNGIECDKAGHVISLDLSNEMVYGKLYKSSSLFKLRYLVRLNLAENYFSSEIPSGISQLTNLEYLNLSYARAFEQFPIEISRMTKLIMLDLSGYGDPENTYRDPNRQDTDLETLTRNLTELRELLLDGVRMPRLGNKWCRILSSNLPKLQVLSLSNCGVSGPFDSSLSKLRSLSVLKLDSNDISAKVPKFFGKFHNLTSLRLSGCGLYGKFPEKVFQLESLHSVDLSGNDHLQGSLPEFPMDGLLHELVLSGTGFTGKLPNSIGNLRFLSTLNLENCQFNGSIPSSFSKLNQLEVLNFINNSFSGSITPIFPSEKLTEINLSDNRLTGQIPSNWNNFTNLVHLFMENNLLNGTIPMGLLFLPSLMELDLSRNQFTGQLSEFFNRSASNLERLYLSNNQLQGLIPESVFGMPYLRRLELSSNNFRGAANSNLVTTYLDYVSFSDNQLTEIPIFLKYQPQLSFLNLSTNQIHGKIPNWIREIGDGGLYSLDLSRNLFEDPDQPWPVNSFESVTHLDLHSNRLQGNNPIVPSSAGFLDYSFNNFTAMIPNISSYLSGIEAFYFSNNQLNGDISTWICEATSIERLDLSYNNLTGPIPSCLESVNPGSLKVLNLKGNNFQGKIPDTLFHPLWCFIGILDLSGNILEGSLPRSIVNCTGLHILDVGHNRLTGTFPYWPGNRLQVLVLRSNKFHGAWGSHGAQCNFSRLQIIDISSNNFTGMLPKNCFSSWNAMIIDKEEREWNHDDEILDYETPLEEKYYPKVTVTSKGVDTELLKILTIFASIDLSNNRFEGEIPEIIGSLTALHTLNFSNNAFTGKIPSTLGNLTHLESLDLSQNKLTGKIPSQLAGLSSLSVLNLSFNKLVGKIPSGGQFQTFESSSFQGNNGLCGLPLSKDCNKSVESPPNISNSKDENASDEFDWVLFWVTFLGFVLGASMVIGPQYFWEKGRQWANKCINKILRIHY